ncbi:MAG: hypothetical protein FWD17_17950 [Polyangiaceae bacterium]|nr:hypothetical protein [Polyangiaceae bacterium]
MSAVDDREDAETRAVKVLVPATSEEWARLEGHAIGRVLDEGTPTQLLPFDEETPTGPVPEWAKEVLRQECLGVGPCDACPEPGIFGPVETEIIPVEVVLSLRRSTPR